MPSPSNGSPGVACPAVGPSAVPLRVVSRFHPKVTPPVDELDLAGVLVRTDYSDDARFAQVLADARRQVGPDPPLPHGCS